MSMFYSKICYYINNIKQEKNYSCLYFISNLCVFKCLSAEKQLSKPAHVQLKAHPILQTKSGDKKGIQGVGLLWISWTKLMFPHHICFSTQCVF